MNKLITNLNKEDVAKFIEIGYVLSGRNKKHFTQSMTFAELVKYWRENELKKEESIS